MKEALEYDLVALATEIIVNQGQLNLTELRKQAHQLTDKITILSFVEKYYQNLDASQDRILRTSAKVATFIDEHQEENLFDLDVLPKSVAETAQAFMAMEPKPIVKEETANGATSAPEHTEVAEQEPLAEKQTHTAVAEEPIQKPVAEEPVHTAVSEEAIHTTVAEAAPVVEEEKPHTPEKVEHSHAEELEKQPIHTEAVAEHPHSVVAEEVVRTPVSEAPAAATTVQDTPSWLENIDWATPSTQTTPPVVEEQPLDYPSEPATTHTEAPLAEQPQQELSDLTADNHQDFPHLAAEPQQEAPHTVAEPQHNSFAAQPQQQLSHLAAEPQQQAPHTVAAPQHNPFASEPQQETSHFVVEPPLNVSAPEWAVSIERPTTSPVERPAAVNFAVEPPAQPYTSVPPVHQSAQTVQQPTQQPAQPVQQPIQSTQSFIQQQQYTQEQQILKQTPSLEEFLARVRGNAFEKKEATEEHKPAPSLNDRLGRNVQIGLNDKLAFVQKLFFGSESEYNRVMQHLNELTSIQEAALYIEQKVKPTYNNWKGKEEYEERFLNLVLKRFEV